ncbi:helix-turn-helix transcriptional regulator [Thauera sp. ZXT1-4]|uniref:helix-turn-helix transcriptional regulator n=1 Tax=Thauera sp. ZXT1-4 TaxID=3460294 RepID=UPI004040C315
MEKQLTAKEVAAALKISLRTLEVRIRSGNAPRFYFVGNLRRWEPKILQAWIEEQYGNASPPPRRRSKSSNTQSLPPAEIEK